MALNRARLRLVADNGENVILETRIDEPSASTLRSLLDLFRRLHPGGSEVGAVQYEDDEGDVVTVTNDEEVREMTRYARLIESEGRSYDPLLVFPKSDSSLNVNNLTVALDSSHRDISREAAAAAFPRPRASSRSSADLPRSSSSPRSNNPPFSLPTSSSSPSPSSPPSPPSSAIVQNQSARQPTADLGQILSRGQIRFEDLEYIRSLGSGNGGSVFYALHKSSRTPSAVKVIGLESPDRDIKIQIISELQTLHQCNTDVIIGFYGAFFKENNIHICTEYMDGGSLDQYGALPERVLRSVAVSIIQGLHYLWRGLKILHRDIKPSNVLVNSRGEVKLCDFGVSIQLVRSIAKSFVGTNAYMSPERILGSEYGMAAEIWSLGLSLLEMALGRFPFARPPMGPSSESNAASALSFMQVVLNSSPELPADGAASPEFVDLIRRSLERDPKDRISSTDFSRHPFFFGAEEMGVGARKEEVKRWVLSRR